MPFEDNMLADSNSGQRQVPVQQPSSKHWLARWCWIPCGAAIPSMPPDTEPASLVTARILVQKPTWLGLPQFCIQDVLKQNVANSGGLLALKSEVTKTTPYSSNSGWRRNFGGCCDFGTRRCYCCTTSRSWSWTKLILLFVVSSYDPWGETYVWQCSQGASQRAQILPHLCGHLAIKCDSVHVSCKFQPFASWSNKKSIGLSFLSMVVQTDPANPKVASWQGIIERRGCDAAFEDVSWQVGGALVLEMNIFIFGIWACCKINPLLPSSVMIDSRRSNVSLGLGIGIRFVDTKRLSPISKEKCYADPGPFSQYRKIMQYWEGGQLRTWRWSSLVKVVRSLLKREQSLRHGWNKDRFGDIGTTNIIHEALTSELFWKYSHFLNNVAGAVDLGSSFCEGCECHEHQGLKQFVPSETKWNCQTDALGNQWWMWGIICLIHQPVRWKTEDLLN